MNNKVRRVIWIHRQVDPTVPVRPAQGLMRKSAWQLLVRPIQQQELEVSRPEAAWEEPVFPV